MKYTMHRNYVVTSTFGHAIRFEKGVPLEVPPLLVPEVVAAGGIPESEIEEEQAKPPVPSGEERNELITEAMKEIVLRAKREDFTAGGSPHVKAIGAMLGFDVDVRERDDLWHRLQAVKD